MIVEEFVYFGSLIHSTTGRTCEISRRSAITRATMQSLKIRLGSHGSLPQRSWSCATRAPYQYPCMVRTARRYQIRTHVAMRSTSGVCVCLLLLGIKWYQFVRNDDAWRLTKQTKLTAIIQSRRLTLFGHIARMDDNADVSLPSGVLEKKQPGRPRITWLSTIQHYLRHHNLTLPKQQIWFRTALCRGLCRRSMALRNLRVVCQKRRQRRASMVAEICRYGPKVVGCSPSSDLDNFSPKTCFWQATPVPKMCKKFVAQVHLWKQEALLSQRVRAMLRVCQ